MKKLILSIALILFSQSFANCLHTILEWHASYFLSSLDDNDIPVLNSDYATSTTDTSITKYFWTGNTIDSIHIEKFHEGKWNEQSPKIDSIFETYYLEKEWKVDTGRTNQTICSGDFRKNNLSIGCTVLDNPTDHFHDFHYFHYLYVIQKDTLFEEKSHESDEREYSNEGEYKSIYVMDEKDTNICYNKNITNPKITESAIIYEISNNNDEIKIVEKNPNHPRDSTTTFILSPHKAETTTAIRTLRHVNIPKNFRFFDLKGRPVNKSNRANHQFLIVK